MIRPLAEKEDASSGSSSVATHVAQMTSVHPPFDTRIYQKIARSLVSSGRRVSLVTCHPIGDHVGGVRFESAGSYSSRLGRMLLAGPRVALKAYFTGARICHFHDPELIPGALLLRLLGRRVIYDVHEDVPRQIAVKHWIPAWIRSPIAWLVEIIELLAAHVFDRIIAATPTIAKRFPPSKTVTIQNFPILGELHNDTPLAARPPHVAYVGVISPERGAREMVEAIARVDPLIEARLRLAGVFSPKSYRNTLENLGGWSCVDEMGTLDRQGVKKLLGSCRVGLVTLHPAPNILPSYPIKLFEYMSAGLPVIASDFPLWREIVGQSGAGLLVDPQNPDAIAAAIEKLLADPAGAEVMGRRGREAVEQTFNWAHEELKLFAMYDALEREDRH